MFCKRLFKPRHVLQVDPEVARINITARKNAVDLLSTRVDEIYRELVGTSSPFQSPISVQPVPPIAIRPRPQQPTQTSDLSHFTEDANPQYTLDTTNRPPTSTLQHTYPTSPGFPVTYLQNTQEQSRPRQPTPPSRRATWAGNSLPNFPSRNIPLPVTSPSLPPVSLIEPVLSSPQPRTGTITRNDSLGINSGLLNFSTVEQTFPRSLLFMGSATNHTTDPSTVGRIKKLRICVITKLQYCINIIAQDLGLDSGGHKRCRDSLSELQRLIYGRGEHLDGLNAAQFYQKMQSLDQTLGRLADQLREGRTKAELERYCGVLSPSLEDFVQASKLWI